MHIQFKAISLSYKNSPLHVREMVALDASSSKSFLKMMEEYLSISEALVVSTCNRTEIYYSSAENQYKSILRLLSILKGIDSETDLFEHFRDIDKHEDAVQHLFDVSLGLEAQVVGDLQIINQIKNAYQCSADENMAGPFLHRLLHSIFYTNKRVVQETAFRDGAASVSYAVVDLIDELTSNHEEPKIFVLGLGEIGEDVARNLERIKSKKVYVCNRSIEKANILSEEFGYEVVPFTDYSKAIQDADVIISSLSVDKVILDASSFIDSQILSHKYLFDLSVPRSIHPDVEDVSGLLLYNIDNIENKANRVLQKRLAAIPDVRSIISEAINDFGKWTQEMEVSPVINKLKNALEEIRTNEIGRYVKNLSEKESEIVDTVTKNMMQKIIRLPVLQLKAACKRGEAESLVEVLNNLFDLEKQSKKSRQ